MPEDQKYTFEIPEQGINETYIKEDAIKFFSEELAFYSRINSVTGGDLIANNRNYGDLRLAATAPRAIQGLRDDISKDSAATLKDYLEKARALRIVVGQGAIGKTVEKLLATGGNTEARWTMYIFSKAWLGNQADEVIAPIRAAVVGNPVFQGFMDVFAAEDAKKHALDARSKIEASKVELADFIREKTELFSSLEDVYRRKLVFDEPAISWGKISASKTGAWRRWLAFFALLIIVPIGLVVFDWNEISSKIVALTSTTTGTISLAGIATISITALLYAWLLKNVSRVFLQNLALADDAAHRRALAITYLGLAENPKLKVDDSERALILNALFRPIPTSVGEEGPPMGLLDLIRHK